MQSRQEEKLAARPNKACAGRDPFADLLFSPRASFIWDHTTRTITWMNAAARSKFGIDAKKVQAALPARTAARLAEGFEAAKANGTASGTVRFKAGRHPAVPCTFEVMELAGGHNGLIVSEAAATQEPANVLRLPTPPKKKAAAKPPGKQPAAQTNRQPAHSAPDAAVCQLTPEEMRAFKAIGRTVRRLARKKRLAATAAHEAPASQPPQRTLPGLDAQGAAAMMFSAFDLVLFLDHDFAVTRTEGRPQQIGWRKASLLGKPAADVLPPAEQAIFRRMVKKLEAGAKVCRDTLLLSGEAGGNVPCRAVFSCWPDGNAHYFLALLSLSVPARLKRSPGLPQITRLAA
jgi:hypothetical protein